MPFDQIRDQGLAEEPFLDVDEDSPCFLQLTSGTTGNPKPWIKSYRSWHAVIDHNLHHLDTFGSGTPPVGPDDVNLHFHPLQWASGFQTLYPYLVRGARTVLVDDDTFDPGALLDVIAAEGVTGTFMPGPLLTPLLDAVQARQGFDHRLRRMVIFFGTPELLGRTTTLLGPIWAHGFGSTEQGASATRLLPSDVASHPARIHSVGRSASPFFDVAVLDDSGKRLPPGEVGRIAVRSAMSLGEYWGLDDASRTSRHDHDWFRSTDIGYLDREGFLYFADRAGDEIRTGGAVVYPHYLEVELMRHPAVSNCGVIGLGTGDHVEVVGAVVLKGAVDASEELEREILAGCDVSLRPNRLVFVEELPTVLGGAKVQRSALRERMQAQLA